MYLHVSEWPRIVAAFLIFAGGVFALTLLLPRPGNGGGQEAKLHGAACFGSLFGIQTLKSSTMLLFIERADYFQVLYIYNVLTCLLAAGLVNLATYHLGYRLSTRILIYSPAVIFSLVYIAWIFTGNMRTKTIWDVSQLLSGVIFLMAAAGALIHFRWVVHSASGNNLAGIKKIRPFYIASVIVGLYIVVMSALTVGGSDLPEIIRVADKLKFRFILHTVLLGFVLVLHLQQPNLFFNVAVADRKHYLNSYLTRVDVADLAAGLKRLMEVEKPYLNPYFNKKSLATLLDISEHQLGELLNKYFGESFAHFTNRFRIEAVCRSLEQNPSSPILDIAFSLGYNSKSVFNSNFRKFVGVSPSEYRQRLKQERSGK